MLILLLLACVSDPTTRTAPPTCEPYSPAPALDCAPMELCCTGLACEVRTSDGAYPIEADDALICGYCVDGCPARS